ncbi:MAG: hypothetical protein ABSG65_29430 [Bryobacteraceae bacterium]|jgi:hypothetical protein
MDEDLVSRARACPDGGETRVDAAAMNNCRVAICLASSTADCLTTPSDDVSGDRKTSIAISVLRSDTALEDWESRHGRTLYASERYAIAKMALFQAFDERPDPAAMSADVQVRAADVEAILITLGIE